MSLSFHGDRGADDATLSHAPNDLDTIVGEFTFHGGEDGSRDTLTLNDTSDVSRIIPFGRTYTVLSHLVDRNGNGELAEFYELEDVTINGSHDANRFDIRSTASGTDLTLNANGGNDEITIGDGNATANIHDGITINPGTGNDELIIDDVDSTYNDDIYIFQTNYFQSEHVFDWSPASAPEEITLHASNLDSTINVRDVPLGTELTINARGGVDVINVHATSPSSFTNVVGGLGADEVSIAPTGQNLDAIEGTIDVHGGSHIDVLAIHDELNDNDTDYMLDRYTLDPIRHFVTRTGAAMIRHIGTNQLDLTTGNGANLFSVRDIDIPTSITARTGSDDFYVGSLSLDAISALLEIDGGTSPNTDYVALYDQIGSTTDYTIDHDQITGNSFVVDMDSIEDVLFTASHLDNTIRLENASGAQYTINGYDGSDTLIMAETSENLNNITRPILFNGGEGDDNLLLHDELSPFSPGFIVTADSIDRAMFGEYPLSPSRIGVTFSSLDTVELQMNDESQTIDVNSTNHATHYLFDGNGGDDVLNINRHIDAVFDPEVTIHGDTVSAILMDIEHSWIDEVHANLGDEASMVFVDNPGAQYHLNLGGERISSMSREPQVICRRSTAQSSSMDRVGTINCSFTMRTTPVISHILSRLTSSIACSSDHCSVDRVSPSPISPTWIS